MARQLNKASLDLIKQWEGLELVSYPDPGSIDGNPWTIGYGHTSDSHFKVYKGQKITKVKAQELLVHDLKEAMDAVEKYVKVPLTDNQYGVLTSFVHNIGVGAFSRSTLVKKLNKKDYDAVPAELARWNKNDGKVMKGLVNRRAAEAGLWARGEFVASANVAVAPSKGAVFTKENVTWGTGIVATAGAGFSDGMGPVQWAFAIIMLVAGIVGIYLFLQSRKNK